MGNQVANTSTKSTASMSPKDAFEYIEKETAAHQVSGMAEQPCGTVISFLQDMHHFELARILTLL